MSVCGCAAVRLFLCSSIPGGDGAGSETQQELVSLEVINPGQCCLQETSQKLKASPLALWGVTCSRSRTLREKGIIHCCFGLRQPVLRSHQLQALLQGIQTCANTEQCEVCKKLVAEGLSERTAPIFTVFCCTDNSLIWFAICPLCCLSHDEVNTVFDPAVIYRSTVLIRALRKCHMYNFMGQILTWSKLVERDLQ